jgi:Protein of unknown function (DUF3631)
MSAPQADRPLSIKEIVSPLTELGDHFTPEEVLVAVRAVAQHINGVHDRMVVELAKLAAKEALQARGYPSAVAKRLVTAAIAAAYSSSNGLAGQPIVELEPEAWPEPVDGAKLLTAMRNAFRRYTVLAPHVAEALALNALRTHAMDAFEFNPILAVISPVERCGKTHVLNVNARLVARPVVASKTSPASIPRTVDAHRPSLILDEVDTYEGLHKDFKGIINSCHHRPSASVTVQTQLPSGEWVPRKFSTYAPVFLGFIGSGTLPRTQWDRAVVVYMQRKKKDETREEFGPEQSAALLPLKRQAIRWALDNQAALRAFRPKMPDGLNDRHEDSWRPLLAIAECAGGPWPELARAAAVALTEDQLDEIPVNIYLLGALREIFRSVPQLPSTVILKRLNRDDEAPWRRLNNGAGLDAHDLAKHLRDFRVRSKGLYWKGSEWIAEEWGEYPAAGMAKGYRRAWLEDAWERYLPPES